MCFNVHNETRAHRTVLSHIHIAYRMDLPTLHVYLAFSLSLSLSLSLRLGPVWWIVILITSPSTWCTSRPLVPHPSPPPLTIAHFLSRLVILPREQGVLYLREHFREHQGQRSRVDPLRKRDKWVWEREREREGGVGGGGGGKDD